MIEELIGYYATLTIRRVGSPGAFLAIDHEDVSPGAATILLLGPEIPQGAKEGDPVEVFIYRDSEGRPLATTLTPKLSLGEVTFLTVTSLSEFGAFFDWGLPKELFVPFAEQTRDLHVGDTHPIGLYVDKTGRLAGTMRVREMLGQEPPEFKRDEWVQGEAWRDDPEIGLFVILDRSQLALLPRQEPHRLDRGQSAKFRVTHLWPDGKIEVSLRAHAHNERATDAEKILEALRRDPTLRIGDKSTPDDLRMTFGLSKKAYKKAAGLLLKQRAITMDDEGFIRAQKT